MAPTCAGARDWSGQPARLRLSLHTELLTFALALCATVAFLSGLLPAVYASRKRIQPGLQSSPLTSVTPWRRRGLIRVVGIIEIAVSLVMITGTCLFAFGLRQLRQFDGGVNRERLFAIELDPMRSGYKDQRAVALDERIRERFAAIPGIKQATFSQSGIYAGRNFDGGFEADGFHPSDHDANYGIYDFVGPRFFTTLGTTILAGQDFSDRDNAAAPGVAIVNQTFARRVFPRGDAVGRNIYVGDQAGRNAFRVVGIVRDVRADLRDTNPMWYFSALQKADHPFATSFLIRISHGRSLRVDDLRAFVHAEDSRLRIDKIDSAEDLLDRTLGTDRLMARLGWAFGILAVLLASVGIYGLLSYDVTRRTGEIGIRTALGAHSLDIARLVVREVGIVTSVGIAAGAVFAALVIGLVRGLVFGIETNDPRPELLATAILVCVALLAAALPARRAALLDRCGLCEQNEAGIRSDLVLLLKRFSRSMRDSKITASSAAGGERLPLPPW